MSGRLRSRLCASSLLCLAACSATSSTTPTAQRYEDSPHRGVAILGRYAAFDDYDLSAPSGSAGGSRHDLDGYGAEVDFLGDGPAFMLGWDEREYEDVDSTEFYAGLRFMLARTDVRPYVAAKVRYGIGLEFPAAGLTPSFDSDEFWGWGAGGGLMAFATDNLFFDLNLSYEDVFSDIDAQGVDVELDGWVGTVGVGFAF